MVQGNGIPAANGSRTRGLLLIGVVFLLGLIIGSALTVIGVRSVMPLRGRPPAPPRAERGMDQMIRRLGLDERQREQVREILERDRRRVREIFEESGNEIRAILTEEQRSRFDEMRRRRPMDGPPFGRPGPGHRSGPGGPGDLPRPTEEAPPPPPPPE